MGPRRPSLSSPPSLSLALLAGGSLLAVSLGVWALLPETALFMPGRRWRRRRLLASLGLLHQPGDEKVMTTAVGLSVDVGSSSVRCSAYLLGRQGQATMLPGSLAQVKREVVGADGTGDTEAILRDIDSVIDKSLSYLRAHGLANDVKAIGFAEFAMNIVGIDEAGLCVTPLMTYADHNPGTAAQAFKLRRKLKDMGQLEAVYSVTGAPIHTGYAPAQLCRLAEEEPLVLSKVWRWQTVTGRALSRWTGKPIMPISYSEASWMGLLDYRGLVWAKEVLTLLPCLKNGATLPPLADYCDDTLGHISGSYADRWPELKEARLFLGLGDGACANIGSGCCDATMLAVTIGTSAAARIVLQSPGGGGRGNGQSSQGAAATGGGGGGGDVKVPFGLWCYRIDRHRLLLGGALTDGGSVVKWLQDTFGITAGPAMQAESASLAPDSHGLTLLPFPSGERAPGWNLDAQAAMVGLTRSTTKAEVYRAALEAVALRLGTIIKLMSVFIPPDLQVSVSGTALQSSPLWRQILADVINRTVMLGRGIEATSTGLAILMAEALHGGGAERRKSSIDVECSHVPDGHAHVAYKAAMRRQHALYEALCNSEWQPTK